MDSPNRLRRHRSKAAWSEGEAGGQTCCNSSATSEAICAIWGARSGRSSSMSAASAASKAVSSSAPPVTKRLEKAPNMGLPRRLHVICHQMVGDLATHRISSLQRVAEMNAAPDAHLFVLLGHLRKAIEFA